VFEEESRDAPALGEFLEIADRQHGHVTQSGDQLRRLAGRHA
jgi:hypothetical protein